MQHFLLKANQQSQRSFKSRSVQFRPVWSIVSVALCSVQALPRPPGAGAAVFLVVQLSAVALLRTLHEALGHQESLVLLLQTSEESDGHLQDVCFLQLGVWLLLEELCTQQRLELLNAAVDPLSAQLLHHRLPQLVREAELLLTAGLHCCSDCRSHVRCEL